MYGVNLSSGLIGGKFAGAFNIDRKIGKGSRTSGRYEGTNYYLSTAFLPSANQSLYFVFHGAPQVHRYSWSNYAGYFKKFGFTANPAPFVTSDVANHWDVKYGSSQYFKSITDGSRELTDNDFVNLSHNFYRKPQAELHWTMNLKDNSTLKATAFYTIGRGGGSSITGNGSVYAYKRGVGINGMSLDTITTNKYGPDGYINSLGVADKVYLKTAVQRISYSFHNQTGLLASYEKKINNNLNITGGAEFRYWKANHPGHFTNLFNKASSTTSYAGDTSTTPGVAKAISFSRKV